LAGGFAELVRDAFWYEQKFDWARNVLRCFHGLSSEVERDILRGDAYFESASDGKHVRVVFEENEEFKKNLAEYVKFVKGRIEELHKEVYELEGARDKMLFGTFSSILPEDKRSARLASLEASVAELRDKINVLNELLRHYDKLFAKRVVPKLTTNVGGYEVPSSLLDEYVMHVVRRIRASLRSGAIIHENPMKLLELEERRRLLHERILQAVGFTKSKRKSKKFREFAEALEEFLEDMGAGLLEE